MFVWLRELTWQSKESQKENFPRNGQLHACLQMEPLCHPLSSDPVCGVVSWPSCPQTLTGPCLEYTLLRESRTTHFVLCGGFTLQNANIGPTSLQVFQGFWPFTWDAAWANPVFPILPALPRLSWNSGSVCFLLEPALKYFWHLNTIYAHYTINLFFLFPWLLQTRNH
jgi:hypothetical protein